MSISLTKYSKVASLSPDEMADLSRDMAESSAWARAELKRRCDEKTKQNAEHGTNNGIAALVNDRVGIIQR